MKPRIVKKWFQGEWVLEISGKIAGKLIVR